MASRVVVSLASRSSATDRCPRARASAPATVPVAVPTFSYWPAVAVPVAWKVQVSDGSSSSSPSASPLWKTGLTPAWSSVTATSAIGTLPGLVTV